MATVEVKNLEGAKVKDLELVDEVGHARLVHLKSLAQARERHRAVVEVQDHQHLVAREGEVDRREHLVGLPGKHLIDSQDGGHGR